MPATKKGHGLGSRAGVLYGRERLRAHLFFSAYRCPLDSYHYHGLLDPTVNDMS